MSSKLPDAAPIPDRPPLHLKGGFMCVASPVDITEACFAMPAVRALRHFRPHSTMAILCPESQVLLWKGMDELNHVISYPDTASARQIGKILLAHKVKFESSICWETSEAAKSFQRANILQRLGYPAKGVEKFLTDPIGLLVEPGPIEHRVRHYLNLLQQLGGQPYVASTFAIPPLALPPEKPVIALAPFSEYGVTYQWPVGKFKELAEMYEESHGKVDWVILSSDSSDAASTLNAELEELLGSRAQYQEAGWEKTLAALPRLSALVSSDNVLAHLAATVGLPAVVVFGPNEPEWKRPLGKQSRVVREHVACSPCYLTKCPVDMRCQDEVTAAMVAEKLQEALTERSEK